MKLALNVGVDEKGVVNAAFDLALEITAEDQKDYAKLLVEVSNTKMTTGRDVVAIERISENHKIFLEKGDEMQTIENATHVKFLEVMERSMTKQPSEGG